MGPGRTRVARPDRPDSSIAAWTPLTERDESELVDGYLLGGPEAGERRWNLLALLLTNTGLSLAHRDDVRDAVEHRFGSLYP
jgi:hypothetical protein